MDEEELREMFDHFDGDGNNRIDRAEFAQLLQALGAEMSPVELDIGFTFIDVNNNGQIEYAEFRTWWHDR